eukprot:NODE_10516_length_589_cov_49.276824_g10239_i0.p2 GENE.NODE_10516_length_589_cov_49.276824_g10239_i0~~NODE_10516_length_589_cov_49.276824_g10239_i0.p2  ORF type:complete len:107 (+),score=1.33 NODE_10516_length_589_cov_49.276824_g10239_i0:141-461(+)
MLLTSATIERPGGVHDGMHIPAHLQRRNTLGASTSPSLSECRDWVCLPRVSIGTDIELNRHDGVSLAVLGLWGEVAATSTILAEEELVLGDMCPLLSNASMAGLRG